MTPDGPAPDPPVEPFGAVPVDRADPSDRSGEDDSARPGYEDEGDEGDDVRHTALPPKLEAWRKRSATGAVLTGFALGLQQAFEKEREQPAIVMQTSGDPPTDLPVEADVEHGRPRQSVVSIRPWLLRGRRKSADAGEAAGDTRPGDA